MSDSNKRRFFFSQQQQAYKNKRIASGMAFAEEINEHGNAHINLLITADGHVFEYTECTGINSVSNFPDAIFLAEDDNWAIIHNGKPTSKISNERLKLRQQLISVGKLKPVVCQHWMI